MDHILCVLCILYSYLQQLGIQLIKSWPYNVDPREKIRMSIVFIATACEMYIHNSHSRCILATYKHSILYNYVLAMVTYTTLPIMPIRYIYYSE